MGAPSTSKARSRRVTRASRCVQLPALGGPPGSGDGAAPQPVRTLSGAGQEPGVPCRQQHGPERAAVAGVPRRSRRRSPARRRDRLLLAPASLQGSPAPSGCPCPPSQQPHLQAQVRTGGTLLMTPWDGVQFSQCAFGGNNEGFYPSSVLACFSFWLQSPPE